MNQNSNIYLKKFIIFRSNNIDHLNLFKYKLINKYNSNANKSYYKYFFLRIYQK